MTPATSLPHRILIADDQADVRAALRLLLKAEGYQIEAVSSPASLLHALAAHPVSLVLMDLNYERDTTSGQEGLDLLDQIRAIDASLPVLVMTAWGNADIAAEAVRRGARGFVAKPWENSSLIAVVRDQIGLSRAA